MATWCLVLFPFAYFIRLPFLGTTSIEYILSYAIVFGFIASLSIKKELRIDGPLMFFSLGFVVSYLVSSLLTTSVPLTVGLGGVISLLLKIGLMLIIYNVVTTKLQLKKCLDSLVFLNCLIAFISFFLIFHTGSLTILRGMENIYYPHAHHGLAILGVRYTLVSKSATLTARVLLLGLPFIYFFAKVYKSSWKKFFYGALFFVSSVVTVLTLSRAGIITLLVTTILIAIRFKGRLVFCSLAVWGLLFALLYTTDVKVQKRFMEKAEEIKYEQAARIKSAKATWESFKEHPLIGTGAKSSRIETATHDPTIYVVVHNVILKILVEAGVLGLTLFLMFMFFYIKRIFLIPKSPKDSWRRGIMKCFQISFISFSMMSMTAPTLEENIFWYFTGLSLAAREILR